MGCDIHVFVERKNEEGKWVAVEGPNPYYGKWDNETPLVLEGWLYNGRNYALFGLLAGVRNETIKPISEQKGIPEDASDEWREYTEDDCDLHSHSYYTLKELEEAEIPETYKEGGMVSPEAYNAYKENGTLPQTWCGWTSRGKWKKLSWEQPVDDMIGDSINNMIKGMRDIITVHGGSNENIRMVFAFDN